MRERILIVALLLLPLSASAGASTGMGAWLILATLVGLAYLVVLITLGWPIILINKLSGRKPNDEIGGKVFALSFVLGPILGVPLLYAFGKSEAGICLFLGWVASILVLNSVLSRTKE